jgi:hypothetical protein
VSVLGKTSRVLAVLLKVIASTWTKIIKRAPAEDAASKMDLRMTFSSKFEIGQTITAPPPWRASPTQGQKS